MKILIDADGCPVTSIAVSTAKKYKLEAIIFCDTSHSFNIDGAAVITVDKGNDSADFALVNKVCENDIIITQDYGLSAMALARKGRPITQNGVIINSFNINSLLESRHMAKKARKAGKHLKGPSKRTKKQNEDFLSSLIKLIENT